MSADLADWEDSKENIKPLRGGRDPLKLSEAFRDPQTAAQKLIVEKQAFEEAIRNDTSSDPLDTWIRYIRWVQQSYTNGTQELIPLVERCADQFIKNPMYKNDQRYIKVWMHYAHLCKEPLDIFGMLDQHDIGLMVAFLYDTKAQFMELKKRYKQAAETYELGLQRGAQPIAWLKRKYEEFQSRWAKQKELGVEEEVVGDENAENRQILGALKPNKKGAVPSVRPTVKGSGIPQANDATKKRKLASAATSNAPFQVFEDTEDTPKSGIFRPEGGSNWGVLNSEATKEKENTQAATKWTGHKIPQKKVRPNSSAPAADFTVYQDEEEEPTPAPPPAKEPQLRARLDNPAPAQNKPVVILDPHKSETGDITGYNRTLIFAADGMEYSFEEIRAAKYAYIEDMEDQSTPVEKTMEMLSISPAFQPIPLAPVVNAQVASVARPPLAAKRPPLAPRLIDDPIPSQIGAPLASTLIPSVLAVPKPSSALPPLAAPPPTSILSTPQVFSTPLSRNYPSSAMRDSASRGMNSTNFDLSFTASNISFTAGPLLSLSSPTINTREALDVADSLLSGVSPAPSFSHSQHSAIKPNLIPDDEADDAIDPNQENAPPPNDENRSRLTNRDIILAELGGKKPAQADKVTNQYYISNQMNRSLLDVTSELVDTEEIANCMAPKMGDAFNFEIYEEPTLSRVTTDDAAPARALREIPLKPTVAGKPDANSNALKLKPSSSYNCTPNQSFNDSLSDSLNLRRSTVRKIDDFFDVSNTSMNSSNVNANVNPNPLAKLANPPADFEIFCDNTNTGGNFEIYSDTKTNSTTFNGSRSSLSLSTTTASSGMITPSRHSKNSTFSGSTLTPLTPLGDTEQPIINPYDEATFIESVYLRSVDLPNFFEITVNSPACPALDIKKRSTKAIELENKQLDLEGLSVLILRCVGEGGYATVYNVDRVDLSSTSTIDSNFTAALKVQSPPSILEFYIGSQLEMKLPQSMKKNFMFFNTLHVYPDRSFLLMDMCELGSLQDTINGYKIANEKIMPEALVMYYTIEMLKIIEAMHECGFIHGDIKPDNFLLRIKDDAEAAQSAIPSSTGLQLIDYGHSIDLSLHPPGAVFNGPGTAAYKCSEMSHGLPWTYHIDTYGLCGVIHCLLHGEYMEVSEQNVAGSPKFRPKLPFKRYWQAALWTQLFDQLLNLPSCHPRPSLTPLRQTLENYLLANPQKIREIQMGISRRRFLASEYFKTL